MCLPPSYVPSLPPAPLDYCSMFPSSAESFQREIGRSMAAAGRGRRTSDETQSKRCYCNCSRQAIRADQRLVGVLGLPCQMDGGNIETFLYRYRIRGEFRIAVVILPIENIDYEDWCFLPSVIHSVFTAVRIRGASAIAIIANTSE